MTVQKLHQPEPLKENRNLLNQRCKNALKKSGEYPNPHYLYSLQLADLALEKGWYEPLSYECRETVSQMYGWKPANAQRYLERNAQGEEIELLPSGKLSPKEIVAAILSEIEDKLALPSASNYPTLPQKDWKPR